jgi:hypothetical protein
MRCGPDYGNLVWNRACSVDRRASGSGDAHLWALLRVHKCVMSGGTTFAKEVLYPAAFAASAEACMYFELPDLGGVMSRVAVIDDEDELVMNDEYNDLVPLDQVLCEAFERRFSAAPADFDPLDEASYTPSGSGLFLPGARPSARLRW